MRAAIYLRCSTGQQNTDIQRADLTRYAKARNLEVIGIFEDLGVSGSNDKRPALDRMIKMARQRRFNFVLVWRLDRLGRNTRHLITLLDELESLQISLVSHQEGFDLSTPIGRVMATVMAALASFEREVLRERVMAGLVRAKANGTRLGRPRKGNAETIASLRAMGKSYREIGRVLGISHSTVISIQQRNK